MSEIWEKGIYSEEFQEVLVLKDDTVNGSLTHHVMKDVLDVMGEVQNLLDKVLEHIHRHPDSVIYLDGDVSDEGESFLCIDNSYNTDGSDVKGDKEFVEAIRKYGIEAVELKGLYLSDYQQGKRIYAIDLKSGLSESDYELAKCSLQRAGIQVEQDDLSVYADAIVLFDYIPFAVFKELIRHSIAYCLNEFFTHDEFGKALWSSPKGTWKFDGNYVQGSLEKTDPNLDSTGIQGFGDDIAEPDNPGFGVFTDDAAGKIWVAEIPNTPNGIAEAGGRYGSLVSEHTTYEEAEAKMQQLDGDRVHYVVYSNDAECTANYVELVGEYNGTYQEICGAHNDFVKDCDTLEEAVALVESLRD